MKRLVPALLSLLDTIIHLTPSYYLYLEPLLLLNYLDLLYQVSHMAVATPRIKKMSFE